MAKPKNNEEKKTPKTETDARKGHTNRKSGHNSHLNEGPSDEEIYKSEPSGFGGFGYDEDIEDDF